MSIDQLPAGWYPDPVKPDQRWRRWDGQEWTGDIREVPRGDLRGEEATSTYVSRPALVGAGAMDQGIAPPSPISLGRTDTAPRPRVAESVPAAPPPASPDRQPLPPPVAGTGSSAPNAGSQVYLNGHAVQQQPQPAATRAKRRGGLPMSGRTLAALIASVLALMFAFTVRSGATVTELVLVLVIIIVAMVLNRSARNHNKKTDNGGPGWLLLVNRLLVLGAVVLLGFGIYALVQSILFSSGFTIPAWL